MVVTHRRPDELAKSLDAVSAQTRAPDHLVVVDNDDDARVRDLVAGQPIATTYLGSRRNLGGAGGFALGMLHALALGADWVWLADDDGSPPDSEVLGTLLACARQARAGRGVADGVRHRRPAAAGVPAAPRAGVAPAGQRIAHEALAGSAARHRVAVQRRAVPRVDAGSGRRAGSSAVRPRRRGRAAPAAGAVRACRSAPAWTRCTCIRRAATSSSRSSAGGCTPSTPTTPTKRFFTYRNRGYLQSQPGMRKLVPQEWLRFGWFFLVSRRDPAGLREWIRLRRLGRREKFERPAAR